MLTDGGTCLRGLFSRWQVQADSLWDLLVFERWSLYWLNEYIFATGICTHQLYYIHSLVSARHKRKIAQAIAFGLDGACKAECRWLRGVGEFKGPDYSHLPRELKKEIRGFEPWRRIQLPSWATHRDGVIHSLESCHFVPEELRRKIRNVDRNGQLPAPRAFWYRYRRENWQTQPPPADWVRCQNLYQDYLTAHHA